MTPNILVARLKARKVYADVPEAEEAKPQRSASNTQAVNSARQNIVTCERMLSARILRSGLSKINPEDTGCSNELLYAKKMVKVMMIVVTNASNNVKRWFQTGDINRSECG
jgi:hypothetical protein